MSTARPRGKMQSISSTAFLYSTTYSTPTVAKSDVWSGKKPLRTMWALNAWGSTVVPLGMVFIVCRIYSNMRWRQLQGSTRTTASKIVKKIFNDNVNKCIFVHIPSFNVRNLLYLQTTEVGNGLDLNSLLIRWQTQYHLWLTTQTRAVHRCENVAHVIHELGNAYLPTMTIHVQASVPSYRLQQKEKRNSALKCRKMDKTKSQGKHGGTGSTGVPHMVIIFLLSFCPCTFTNTACLLCHPLIDRVCACFWFQDNPDFWRSTFCKKMSCNRVNMWISGTSAYWGTH